MLKPLFYVILVVSLGIIFITGGFSEFWNVLIYVLAAYTALGIVSRFIVEHIPDSIWKRIIRKQELAEARKKYEKISRNWER